MATGLYHSKLVPLGPVWVTVTTDWKQSKDKNSMYCGLTINGAEHWYTAENAACQDALNGLSGRTVLIQASGSRESAQIDVLEEQTGGAPQTAPRAAAPTPRPAAAPVARPAAARPPAPAPVAQRAPVAHAAPAPARPEPPVQVAPEQAIAEASAFLQRNRLLLELCSYEAGRLAVQYNTVVMKTWIDAGVIPSATPEQIQSWTSCLFIEANKAGFGRTLPTDSENDQPPM